MAEYDLTHTLLKYVDRHLGFPLLSHLASTDLFNSQDIVKAQYELAKGTSMVDYTESLHDQAFPGQSAPKELQKHREDAIAMNARLEGEVETVLAVITDEKVASALRQDKESNLEWLRSNYNLTLDQITTLYHYGYFQFSCGNYAQASSYLYHFRILSTDPDLTLSSHWGKLAADLLSGEWDRALEELKLIREQIDTPHRGSYAEEGGAEALLQKRTWLLHWSLFVWFNHAEGRQYLVEMFLSPPYLNTIQTTSWWLLRYLVAALILTRRTSRIYMVPGTSQQSRGEAGLVPSVSKVTPTAALRDVSRIILSESEYRLQPDPLVDFIAKLYGDFDFEAAQAELAKAEKVAEADFFLSDFKDGLVEGARYLISEAYTRVHQRVDIADLSKRLNLSQEEGEKWIVNLVRDTRADAKIDFQSGIVSMNLTSTHPPIYQTIIEQTRGFTFRTAAMGQAIDRKAHPPVAGVTEGQLNASGVGAGTRGGRGGRGGSRGGGSGRGGRGGGAGGRGGAPQQDGQQPAEAPAATA